MHLNFAFSPNPRIQPLLDGRVAIDGVTSDWTTGSPADLHLHHLTKNTFDVFEFSISNYMIVQDRVEQSAVRWKALPIFLLKAFMWMNLLVNARSDITSFADLRGKRVGIPDYQMTAAIWMRIVLRRLYGIQPQDIAWVNGRSAAETHGENVTGRLAPGIHLTRLDAPNRLNQMLHAGEIDAAYGDTAMCPVIPGGDVGQLLSPGQDRELMAEFTKVTGLSPVNHVVVMQEKLIEAEPGLPMRLYTAFEESKRMAYEQARRDAPGYLLFAAADFARQASEFGEDPFPSGLEKNRAMLRMVADEELAEGLVQRYPNIDGLFAEGVRGT